MSKKVVKTNALAWSGASRRVGEGKANQGAVEGMRLGVAESATASQSGTRRSRSKSLFTERPAVDVQRVDDEDSGPTRPNGRVSLKPT